MPLMPPMQLRLTQPQFDALGAEKIRTGRPIGEQIRAILDLYIAGQLSPQVTVNAVPHVLAQAPAPAPPQHQDRAVKIRRR